MCNRLWRVHIHTATNCLGSLTLFKQRNSPQTLNQAEKTLCCNFSNWRVICISLSTFPNWFWLFCGWQIIVDKKGRPVIGYKVLCLTKKSSYKFAQLFAKADTTEKRSWRKTKSALQDTLCLCWKLTGYTDQCHSQYMFCSVVPPWLESVFPVDSFELGRFDNLSNFASGREKKVLKFCLHYARFWKRLIWMVRAPLYIPNLLHQTMTWKRPGEVNTSPVLSCLET